MRKDILIATVISLSSPAVAQQPAASQADFGRADPGRADTGADTTNGVTIVSQVTACRGIAASSARLACFDKAAAALDDALAQKSIVILDRQAVRETRRSLFGFNLPRLPFFGGRDDPSGEPPETREIQAVIASANPLPHDNWRIRLQDGATWQTTEAFRGYRDPAAGSAVTITRGPLGSYSMRVGNQRAVRVARQN